MLLDFILKPKEKVTKGPYIYDGPLTNDVVSWVHQAFRDYAFCIEMSRTPDYNWMVDNLTMHHQEWDNSAGNRESRDTLMYTIISKVHGDKKAGYFFFINVTDDYMKILDQYPDRIISAVPFKTYIGD